MVWQQKGMLESLLCMYQSGQYQPIQWERISLVTINNQALFSAAYESIITIEMTYTSEFSTEINVEKTRVMAFRGMEPIRSNICINNKTLQQQNTFNYLV
jgi:hypothetical protein